MLGNITCIGAGHMGQQIALQCAVNGFNVSLFSRKKEGLGKAKSSIQAFCLRLVHLKIIEQNQINEIVQRINFTTDLIEATSDSDILIECVVEDLEIKRKLFKQLESICPEKTIFCTNTSAIVPSKIASVFNTPGRFIAVHFHTYVWEMNFVDIMPHPQTDPETLKVIKQFVIKIKQIPIVMSKESAGYIFTALLSSLNNTAIKLAREGVASVGEIDKSWRAAMKMPMGPFGIMDYIGLDTLRDICQYWGEERNDSEALKNADYLNEFVSEGNLGIKSGKGFYDYTKKR
ncbi:3-hydroxyacyl-CoA dehydrogenase [Photobacterium lutimaris]|nr:3-hydroxyacyl-CoA dehydrogenase [Photobacterium lutimaris]TDR78532.1 3-hydroxybutyryl-CoA dehydrogenase [Photobacterium lutimaris]